MRLIVIFFDTNVLVYSTINQDRAKQKISDSMIDKAIMESSLSLSPLVISEFVFVLSKLNIDKRIIEDAIKIFRPFVILPLEPIMVFEAYELCRELGHGRNINDAIHLKFAEKHCTKIVTFDSEKK